MEHLFILLFIPIAIGVGGWFLSRFYHDGSFNWKELLAQVGVGLLVAGTGFFTAMCHQTSDTEIWNGRIAKKWHDDWEHCCHSYQECHTTYSGSGKNRTSHQTCITKYRHSHDEGWYARTTNDEMAYANSCNSPGTSTPSRWKRIKVGEPTAIEHQYTNYIKGNPDSVIRRKGVKDAYGDLLPSYPSVTDHYRVNRVLGVGVSVPDAKRLDDRLDELNADLGAKKEVNIILLVVKTADRGYLHALEEHWLGGKKNDVVIIVGTTDFPKIAWAGVMSWSDSEEMKLAVRDRIEALDAFDGDAILKIVNAEISEKFVRKRMSDFEYLSSTISPSTTWLWILYVLSILLAVGLQYYFWKEDPFGEDGHFGRMRFRRRNRF